MELPQPTTELLPLSWSYHNLPELLPLIVELPPPTAELLPLSWSYRSIPNSYCPYTVEFPPPTAELLPLPWSYRTLSQSYCPYRGVTAPHHRVTALIVELLLLSWIYRPLPQSYCPYRGVTAPLPLTTELLPFPLSYGPLPSQPVRRRNATRAGYSTAGCHHCDRSATTVIEARPL